ncbi:MAG: hypothetical protein WDO13_04895 [Verrucomicrobiota bacterium]
MAPEGYLLTTKYRNNTVTGWIKARGPSLGHRPGRFRRGAEEPGASRCRRRGHREQVGHPGHDAGRGARVAGAAGADRLAH